MVHITYRHGLDSSTNKRIIVKERNFYISDDRCHDLHYVQHCTQIFYDHLKDINIQMDQHYIWSDGCVGQFKNDYVFQWLSILHKTYNVSHIWNYFKTQHGWGEHDEAGTCIKYPLWREDMEFMINIYNIYAKSIVQWSSIVMLEQMNNKHQQGQVMW